MSAERTDPAFAQLAESFARDHGYFPQTGHTLGGAFEWFWQSHGGLAIFGYPISEEFVEQGVLVQYFERARFEYRPEHVGAEVQIGMLGRAYAQRMGVTERLLAPALAIVQLGTATLAIPASAQHNVALATQQFDRVEVAPGTELSFLHTIGEVSARGGYESGQAIVKGEVRSRMGGGICYLSTALYRAAFLAGLPIIERHPHSVALASLSDVPGFDSAVDTSGLDLRWQNDTPHVVLVMGRLNGGRLTVTLWGQSDGRTTTMHGPRVKTEPETQVTTIGRVVVAANGALLRNETVQSRYAVLNTTTPTRNQASTR
jgi:vancomycin resistance protein YoaR